MDILQQDGEAVRHSKHRIRLLLVLVGLAGLLGCLRDRLQGTLYGASSFCNSSAASSLPSCLASCAGVSPQASIDDVSRSATSLSLGPSSLVSHPEFAGI